MTTTTRRHQDIAFELSAPPADVFPLLCPVREYEWIPDWRCTMVHSDSGVAELGCVFTRDEGETWITTRYEPPHRIDYAIFSPGAAVGTLEFRLTPSGPGTRVDLHTTRTATTEAGLLWLETRAGDHERVLWEQRRRQLEHFLTTGVALPLPTPH